MQYSRENASTKFLGTSILKNIFVQLLLKWLYDVIVWNFVSGSHLKPYQSLSNQSFKKVWRIWRLRIQPLSFLVNLGFVCLSLKVRTQNVNACSPWTSFKRCSNISLSLIWLGRKYCRWNWATTILEQIH